MLPSITLQKVSKRYRRNMTSFRSLFGYLFGIVSPHDFLAVQDLTIDLRPGDAIGILGVNGAGKSTILKLIAGITKPSQGSIVVSGTIGALIEVGAGFHPELSGRENIFLYGAILGMTRKEIKEKLNSIVSFAELEGVLDTPVKFYSSGMYARLGFAVTIAMNPDILIVDEALAVGDTAFQEKCLATIEDFRAQGKIILFVSHNLPLIEKYMTSCLVLEQGLVVKKGTPQECVPWYYEHIIGSNARSYTIPA